MPAMGTVVAPLQQPKKWVRWSEDEDRILGKAVEQYGENNFRQISEQVFQGTRTEQQCKNRWKKVSVAHLGIIALFVVITMSTIVFTHLACQALQPGLVKGRWTKEEDDIITSSVHAPTRRSGTKLPSVYLDVLVIRSRSVGLMC